jgi:hypothetical protein
VPVAWPFMLMACYLGPSFYTLPHSVLLPKISRVGANLTATLSNTYFYGDSAKTPLSDCCKHNSTQVSLFKVDILPSYLTSCALARPGLCQGIKY